MNWLRKLETKSIVVALSFLFILAFANHSLAGIPVDHKLYNGNAFILLKKDHSFVCSDTALTQLTFGKWKLHKDQLVLSSMLNDTLMVRDTVALTYQSKQRISLRKGATYFTFKTKEKEKHNMFSSILKGILGILALIFIGFLFSTDRKSINWSLILKGVVLQVILALLILKAPFVEDFFEFLSRGFVKVVDMAHHGAEFVFGSFMDGKVNPYIKNFATWILPSLIFFSALSSLLYYWGILQKVVIAMAWLMKKILGLSGAESVSAAGNIFLGQTEAPLLVRPYLSTMTKSEILCLMAGGMATIAGGVLASYIGFLGGEDEVQKIYFAKHLLTASLMSAPAAIIFAKLILPEKEKFNTDLSVSKEKLGTNSLEALANGTTDGLRLAVNVGAMLIVFISLVALANYLL
ncbi:MAG: Na+ dependent nucleoside transporter, partial [Crocinitomicaceae bacterium]|nr:Na+ dependent nucleoside transporter [Crocinitomicaceae bacterium]